MKNLSFFGRDHMAVAGTLANLSRVVFEQGRYSESKQYLEQASKAPPRPGRERADEGRRAEIATLEARIRAKLG